MSALSLGPWVFPVAVVGLVLGVIAAEATASFLARRGHPDVGHGIWISLVAGVLGARTAYVIQFWASYRAHPLDIVDLRDLGFSWIGGVLALLLTLTALAWRRPLCRRALPASLAVGLAVWGLVGVTTSQLRSGSHPPLPEVTLHDLDGGKVALASLAGKPMIINLWATWCAPCRREMPILVEAQKAQPQLRFVFADQGEPAATVKRFLAAEGLTPDHVLIDSGMQLTRYYRAPGYPTTVFLDADGRLQDTHVGPLSRATLADQLQRITPHRITTGVPP